MMAWPTRNNNSTISEAAFQWTDAELENWRTEHLKQPETFLLSPSPDPSTTARTPTARPLSYNYQFQLPSTQFPSMPVALGAMLSPTPSSSYLGPSTIKRSINNHSPRSVPTHATHTAPSPASLYDARCPSPWDDLPVSTPIIKETFQLDEASNGHNQTKMPCRSRQRGAKRKCVFSSFPLGCNHLTHMLNTPRIGRTIITEPSNANGRAVNMTVYSHAKVCSCDTSRLSISIHVLSSVPGATMLRVDGRI